MKTSKVNCKHQKSIVNSKIWIQFWEPIAISVCFCCCSEGKRREIVTMNLRSHATLRIEHFHQKAMFIKVHLDFVHELQVQLKGLVPKNKGHTNFYEHCDLTKNHIYTYLYVCITLFQTSEKGAKLTMKGTLWKRWENRGRRFRICRFSLVVFWLI